VTVGSLSGKELLVHFNKSNMIGSCSCKLYESNGIPCQHIIQVLRSEKHVELPMYWEKRGKRYALNFFFYRDKFCNGFVITFFYKDIFFDDEGNLLEDVPADPMKVAIRKKNSEARNKFEDLIQKAKHSNEGLNFLSSNLSNLETTLQKMVPCDSISKQDEYESFIGTKIPKEVVIHPPNNIKAKGRCKTIKKSKEIGKGRSTRVCSICKQTVQHD
jgi:hypothetical protein